MGKSIRRLFGRSKRQRLVYLMMFVWITFGIMCFFSDKNFANLATYYGTFAGPAMMYLWGETKRPHNEPGELIDQVEFDRA